MSPEPSRRILELPRSGVRAAMARALAVEGVLRLDIGDPDFDTPPHAIEAAARAAAAGWTHYSPSAGLASLRERIAADVAERWGRPCAPDQVVVTSGGCGAVYCAFLTLLDPGDEVLVPDPGWPNYVSMAHEVGARPVGYPLSRERGFALDAAAIERVVGPRTRAVVVNSPGNPTGAVFERDALESLLELAQRHDLWVVSDECYDRLVLDGQHVASASVGEPGRVVTVGSFSKTYAMTGWRVGYAVAPARVAALLALAQEPVVSCPSTVAQKAAEAALTGPQTVVDEMRAAYRRRRDAALAVLDAHGVGYVRPRGGFYLLVDATAGGEPSAAVAGRALREQHVAVVAGSAFGRQGEGLVRVSLAASDDVVVEGVGRLAALLAREAVGV